MIDKKQVLKIADLAKLELTDAEAERFAKELSKVVDYIDELNEVATEGVEPTLLSAITADHLRPDIVAPWDEDERRQALSQADTDEKGNVKTSKIL